MKFRKKNDVVFDVIRIPHSSPVIKAAAFARIRMVAEGGGWITEFGEWSAVMLLYI